MGPRGTSGLCGPLRGGEAHPPVPLPPESALDDLDLNEFGVAALEKTFDSSSVPHPGSITVGGSLLQSSAPVNIPGSLGSSASFHSASPSPPVSLSSHFLQQPQGHLSQSENTFLGTSASHGSLGKRVWLSATWGRNRGFRNTPWPLCPRLEAVQSGGESRGSGREATLLAARTRPGD